MRVGTIQYSTDQGISHLAKDFYDAGVITDVMTFRHGSRPGNPQWYPPETVELVGRPFNGPVVEEFIKSVDVMLFFETPHDWEVIKLIRRLGRRSAIVPMYECTAERYTPSVKGYLKEYQPDKWVCPSLLDCEYFPNSPFVPIPLPTTLPPWTLRTNAERFLHNGGNLGLRGHKGTREIMLAMKYVKAPIQLTIRAQDDAGLHALVREIPSIKTDSRVTFEYGSRPRETLFDGHDVFIMAEKYNGLSLPLAEARGVGMVVMTSDRFPMNTWLNREFLIPVSGYTRQRVGGPFNWYDEATVQPESIAAMIDQTYALGKLDGLIEQESLKTREWRRTMSWDVLKDQWLEVLA